MPRATCPNRRCTLAFSLSLFLPSFLSFLLFISLSRISSHGVENCLELVISLETSSSRRLFNRGGKVVLGDQRERGRGRKILSIRLDLDFDLEERVGRVTRRRMEGGWRLMKMEGGERQEKDI